MTQSTPSASVIFGWGKVSEETAVLLAAAPELLEALVNLVGRFEGCTSRSSSPELNAFRNAHEAITKAETI